MVQKLISELCEVLRNLIELLESDGDTHWSQWMSRALNALEQGDQQGANYVLRARGGMGSFNDLIIGQRMDGDKFSWAPNANELNDKLDSLRSQAYELAQSIIIYDRTL